ncbi:hypothetical protein Csa_006185 [Cucumis sativus]|uniref:Uncharacterized protein n=1 Tax=Cucumis sativus TaxID=3659 RepID=A0A0A0LMK2_CUCSA|nr:hypothetical protein Csa_006185 [Cucumis sativus]
METDWVCGLFVGIELISGGLWSCGCKFIGTIDEGLKDLKEIKKERAEYNPSKNSFSKIVVNGEYEYSPNFPSKCIND